MRDRYQQKPVDASDLANDPPVYMHGSRPLVLSVQAGIPLQLVATVLPDCAGPVHAAAADIRGAVEQAFSEAVEGVAWQDVYAQVEDATGMHNGKLAQVFRHAVRAAWKECREAEGG